MTDRPGQTVRGGKTGGASGEARRAQTFVIGIVALAGIATAGPATAQPAAPAQAMTLDRAIQYAADHYPSVKAALEEINASTAAISVARGAYLPRLDSVWQANRATANNIFGQLLPQSVIPAMSGPVLPSTSGDSVWGSAAGALLSWEPVDFGLRHAAVAGAEASLARARADEALTQLEVEATVGNAFLAVVAAERTLAAARADLDRRDVLQRSVHTLVDTELRPGADASRADAERAAAQTRVIQAGQTVAVARTTLARVLGMAGGPISVDAEQLVQHVPQQNSTTVAEAGAHPLAQVRQAAVGQARAAEEVLARTDYPRVFLQSSIFARGSGANPNGVFGNGGLWFDRANWAAGVQVVLPNLFDFSTLRARKTEAAASERAEAARYDEALLAVTAGQQAAAAVLQSARDVAANTPIQLAAAKQSETQARARYDAGLASLVEVADAQSLLAQADVQDQIARVDVWRALLAEAVARGDLAPFVRLVQQP